FLRQCVATEPDPTTDDYRREVRDCKLFVTRSLAHQAAALFTSLGGSAYRFASPVSRKVRDLLAGPLLRPPVGVAFDDVWSELADAGDAEAGGDQGGLIAAQVRRESHSFVDDLETNALIGALEADAGHGAAGVALNVRQSLLHDAEQRRLHLPRKAIEVIADL